jgi:FkbM family methyltransferase
MLKSIYYPDVPFRTLYIPEILKEVYIDQVFSRVKQCDVILDVGANIGLTAMYLKDLGKKVFALEPSPEHFEALAANIGKNQWKNVSAHNMAMARKSGHATFYQDDWNRTTHSLLKRSGKSLEVWCTTFAEFMEQQSISKIDFCKLDVEGAEEAILFSEPFTSVCHSIKSLLIEFHDLNKVSSIVDHMSALGYTWYNIPANAIIYWFERL